MRPKKKRCFRHRDGLERLTETKVGDFGTGSDPGSEEEEDIRVGLKQSVLGGEVEVREEEEKVESFRGFVDVERRETVEEEELRVLVNLCETMVNPDEQPKICTALSIIRQRVFAGVSLDPALVTVLRRWLINYGGKS